MANLEYLKCPGSDPLSKAVPELFPCPECAGDIEIWTDELGGKCPSCGRYFKKVHLMDNTPADLREKLQKLIQSGCESGASEATVIPARDIVIDASLAEKCRAPQCENYGLSKSCPPHVAGPVALKKRLENFCRAIFFKIDVPPEMLYSSERRELFALLHETASGIESVAVELGFANALAYAGGSCKKIFCHEYKECLAISKNGKCRNPQKARPSMSGFGIDVAKLFKTAGWSMSGMAGNSDSAPMKMANVCGLVLIH